MQIGELTYLNKKCSNFKQLGFLSRYVRKHFPNIVTNKDYLKKIDNFEIVEIDIEHKRIKFRLNFIFVKCPENIESEVQLYSDVGIENELFYIEGIKNITLNNLLKKFKLELTN